MKKPLAIFHRTDPYPHMEIHFIDHVEFWDYNDIKCGESKVHEM